MLFPELVTSWQYQMLSVAQTQCDDVKLDIETYVFHRSREVKPLTSTSEKCFALSKPSSFFFPISVASSIVVYWGVQWGLSKKFHQWPAPFHQPPFCQFSHPSLPADSRFASHLCLPFQLPTSDQPFCRPSFPLCQFSYPTSRSAGHFASRLCLPFCLRSHTLLRSCLSLLFRALAPGLP